MNSLFSQETFTIERRALQFIQKVRREYSNDDTIRRKGNHFINSIGNDYIERERQLNGHMCKNKHRIRETNTERKERLISA